MKFINSIEFFDYCQELYANIMEKQYSDMEQGSALYHLYIKSLEYLSSGKYFLMPNTNEYYSLNDSDIFLWKRDDRLLFIDEIKKSEDVFKFVLSNSRGYTNEVHGLHWRRIPVWESKKEIWDRNRLLIENKIKNESSRNCNN